MKIQPLKVIISGGGSGGHIFPAIALADKLKEINGDSEILFVGASNKMEMEKIPAAGYQIKGLPMTGLQRKMTFRNICSNLKFPFRLIKSIYLSKKILEEFEPDIVIGTGGFASAPMLWCAAIGGVPTIIQEQNSHAGLANKILGRRADRICVAYEGMERFFPEEKIVITGNPIRKDLCIPPTSREKNESKAEFGMSPDKKHVFIMGGSLGCKTLNDAVMNWIEAGSPGGKDICLIWQCGKFYKKNVDEFIRKKQEEGCDTSDIRYFDFIKNMKSVYAAADIVVSRAGACSISELACMKKAVIFVPSPNVAEDHQTKNAEALARKGAALVIKDCDAEKCLMSLVTEIAGDEAKLCELSRNMGMEAKPDASLDVLENAYSLVFDKREEDNNEY